MGCLVGQAGCLDGGGIILNGKVAILQLPGSNCEYESLQAVERAGGVGEIVRWNEPEEHLFAFSAYVIPGGFSYQDRIRAGAVSARLPVLTLTAYSSLPTDGFDGCPTRTSSPSGNTPPSTSTLVPTPGTGKIFFATTLYQMLHTW